MKRKLHFRIAEEGKPDFGFEAVTDLDDMDIVDLLKDEKTLIVKSTSSGPAPVYRLEREKAVAEDVKRRGAFVHPADRRPELKDLMGRKGLPGELQREIYKATLPIFRKHRAAKNSHMNKDRILGLALDALTEAWISAR